MRARLANHSEGDFRIIRCSTRRTPRNDTNPTNGLVLELRRREGHRRFLLVDVIGEIVELLESLRDGALSDGMVLKSEWIDWVPPRGLVMPTIAVGIDNNEGDLGRGICAGQICGIT